MPNNFYLYERQLLRRCAEDDLSAQTEFLNDSYLNLIYRTGHEVNVELGSPLDGTRLTAVCEGLTGKIYRAYETLPSRNCDLRQSINRYVWAEVHRYISERAGVRNA
jgi:hypothetical protein